MASPVGLTLIIDGNNLAHYLYHLLPRQPVPAMTLQRMAEQLSRYARSAQLKLEVELCLDPLPADTQFPNPVKVRVLPAKFPEEADDVVLQRFWYYHYKDQPCLIITNDSMLCDKVEQD